MVLNSTVSRIIYASIFVFCCHTPFIIFLDKYFIQLELRPDLKPEYIEIIYGSAIIGAVAGGILCTFFGIFYVLLFTVITEICLLLSLGYYWDYTEPHFNIFLTILIIIGGLLMGIVQVTVTIFFGDQYKLNNLYTTADHYTLFIMLNVLRIFVSSIGLPTYRQQIPGGINWSINAWVYVPTVIVSLVSLVLVFNMKQMFVTREATTLQLNTLNYNKWGLNTFEFWILFILSIFWVFTLFLEKRWIKQGQNMDRNIISNFVLQENSLPMIQAFITLLCIPLLLWIYRQFYITDIERIKFGGIFILLTAICSGFIDLNLNEDNYVPPKLYQTYIRLFINQYHPQRNEHSNWTAISDRNINASQFSFANDMLLYHEAYGPYTVEHLSQDSLKHIVNYTVQENNMDVNLKKLYFLTPNHDFESWNFFGVNGSKHYLYKTAMNVYRSVMSFPKVYIFHNVKQLSVELYSPQTKLNITIANKHTHEIPDDLYEIRFRNRTVERHGQMHFKSRGFYVLLIANSFDFLEETKYSDSKHEDQATLEVLRPCRLNWIWLLPQYILLSIGKTLILVSYLHMSYDLTADGSNFIYIILYYFILDLGIIVFLVFDLLAWFGNFGFAVIMFLTIFYLHFYNTSI